jgi:hypothetical protein
MYHVLLPCYCAHISSAQVGRGGGGVGGQIMNDVAAVAMRAMETSHPVHPSVHPILCSHPEKMIDPPARLGTMGNG